MSTPTLVKLPEAIRKATSDADLSMLPQTVYKTTETYGWANTHTHASVLTRPRTTLKVTILPARYFPGACAQSAEEEEAMITRGRENWGLYIPKPR